MFCCVIMLTPGVKNGSFFILSVDDNNKSVTIWTKYSCASERFNLKLFHKILWIMGL